MRVELINIGTELLRGATANTHLLWLGERLARAGLPARRQTCVEDEPGAVAEAVAEALERARLAIVTGGLGPTADDRTREAVAALLGRKLTEAPEIRERIRAWYRARGREVPPQALVQARVPEGAEALVNRQGAAPGLWIEIPDWKGAGERTLVLLPGPPRELRPMFETEVLPRLLRLVPAQSRTAWRRLRTMDVPESVLEQRLAGALEELERRGLEVGYCARPGETDLHLAAAGPEAERLVEEAAARARRILGERVYGEGDETLEQATARLLIRQGRTLAAAESCTGGLLAHRITNVPGVSAAFLGGVVAYSNEAKRRFLGVPAEALERHGAVSEPVALAMARGARERFGADYALGVTGVAGPGGGTPEKPVGTVWIALAGPEGAQAVRRLNRFDRETFKRMTARQALDMLRLRLLGAEPAAPERAPEPAGR